MDASILKTILQYVSLFTVIYLWYQQRSPGLVGGITKTYIYFRIVAYLTLTSSFLIAYFDDYLYNFISICLAFAGYGALIFSSLQGQYQGYTSLDEVARLKERIKEAEQKIIKLERKEKVSPSVSPEDFKKINDYVQTYFKNQLKSDLIDEVRKIYSEEVINNESLQRILIGIASTQERIKAEIQNSKVRGTVNLTIGIIATAIPILALVYISFFDPNFKSVAKDLGQIIPRMSLILLSEVFALFFLRLYRNSLFDIKYYQNELTNIESKFLAFHVSYVQSDQTHLKSIIEDYLKVERNSILKQGENLTTTILSKYHISKDRSFIEGFKAALESLASILGQKNDEKTKI